MSIVNDAHLSIQCDVTHTQPSAHSLQHIWHIKFHLLCWTDLLAWNFGPATPAVASHSHFLGACTPRGSRAGPWVADGLTHMRALGKGFVAGLVAAQQLGSPCLASLQRCTELSAVALSALVLLSAYLIGMCDTPSHGSSEAQPGKCALHTMLCMNTMT